MDTLHAAMVSLEPFIVDTPEKWPAGLDDDVKGLGVVALTDSRRCGHGRARHRVYEPGRGGQAMEASSHSP